MKAKHWYDYLWVYAIIYFALGFFNILFAWLGMIDFLLPLFLAIFGGNKFFCNHLCGRGQLFSKLGTDLKCSRCTKPFGTEELLARIRAVLRSHRHSKEEERSPGGKFRLQDLLIDYDTRQVFVGKEEIDLTQTEYNIMAFLSVHAGKVLTYAAIIRAVWGYSDYGSVKKLQVNMKNIRKKMGVTPGEKRYIINELGVGYRMLAEDEA